MSQLLPFRSDTQPADDRDPRVVNLESDEATEVIEALGSDTARAILGNLYEDPAPPSDISEALDLSLQNVRYHLQKLEDADLIEVVDTWYSSRGNEMYVYAPTDAAVVLFSGPNSTETKPQLRRILARIVGALGLLAITSFAVERAITALGLRFVEQRSGDQGVSQPGSDGEILAQIGTIVTETVTPGMLFFLGGLVALGLVGLWWQLGSRV